MNNIVPSDPELALVPFQPLPPDKNPALLYIARLNSKASRDSMRSALHRVARMLGYPGLEAVPWHLFTAAHVRLARAKLAERYPAVTTNHALVALRGVLRESFILGLTTNEDWNRIQLERGIPGSRLLAGRALEQSEITPLVGAVGADMGPLAVRNVALLAVLLGAGLRRAEAVSLDINSWDPSARQITVIGKGNKERIMPIGAAAAAAVGHWISVRGSAPGPLFVAFNKGGRMTGRRCSDDVVGQVVDGACRASGVLHCSPHDFRRTAITMALDADADLLSVQNFAGHASPETTKKYDRRGLRAMRKAADGVFFPQTEDFSPAAPGGARTDPPIGG